MHLLKHLRFVVLVLCDVAFFLFMRIAVCELIDVVLSVLLFSVAGGVPASM